jgi:subtilase family serine protease
MAKSNDLQKPSNESPEMVRAYAILRGQAIESVSFVASPISSESVEKAIQVLKGLGFSVLNSNSLSVLIEGEKRLFEKVFGSKVLVSRPSKKGLKGVLPQESFVFQGEPQIPDSLKELVQAISLGSQLSLH